MSSDFERAQEKANMVYFTTILARYSDWRVGWAAEHPDKCAVELPAYRLAEKLGISAGRLLDCLHNLPGLSICTNDRSRVLVQMPDIKFYDDCREFVRKFYQARNYYFSRWPDTPWWCASVEKLAAKLGVSAIDVCQFQYAVKDMLTIDKGLATIVRNKRPLKFEQDPTTVSQLTADELVEQKIRAAFFMDRMAEATRPVRLSIEPPIPFKDKEKLLRALQFQKELQAKKSCYFHNQAMISFVYVVVDEFGSVLGVFTELERAEKCKGKYSNTRISQHFLNE